MPRILIFKAAVLIGVWLLLSGAKALACSCFSPGRGARLMGVRRLFFGTPIGVVQTKSEASGDRVGYSFPKRVFTFSVDEAFRGVEGGKSLRVLTGQGGGDCGYDFKIGDPYLVYAHRTRVAGCREHCSRTRPAGSALEDLEYIRSLANRAACATLSGSVQQMRRNLETEQTQNLGPLTDIKIVVEADGLTFRVQTDKNGRYSLSGLPAGRYKVRPILPAKLNTYDTAREVVLHDRGCAAVDFHITDNGRIRGRITDSEGKPVARIMVDLIPVSQGSAERPGSMFDSADDQVCMS